MRYSIIFLIFISLLLALGYQSSSHKEQLNKFKNQDLPPIEKIQLLNGLDVLIRNQLHLIYGKNLGLVTNHTGLNKDGVSNYTIFMELDDVNLKAIFAPEHGFFGNVSAGKNIENQQLNDFPMIYSLYGNIRKPTLDMLEGLDVIIYDIQDIGARFYTYISTLGLVMEAAAEAGIPVIVLDRPNPLGGQKIEGPILDVKYSSFVGMYPIPIRYGLTIGELAKMIVGEKWIASIPELTIVKMEGWTRNVYFNETDLKFIPPSPNIPDVETAVIYPGMCLIEGTNVSEGRGTSHPFNWIGAPWIDGKNLAQIMNKKHLPGIVFEPVAFTPVSLPGKALFPKYENEKCYGISLKILNFRQFNSVLTGVYLMETIKELYPNKFEYKSSLTRLWGNKDIISSKTDQINLVELIKYYENFIKIFKDLSSEYFLYD